LLNFSNSGFALEQREIFNATVFDEFFLESHQRRLQKPLRTPEVSGTVHESAGNTLKGYHHQAQPEDSGKRLTLVPE
jgi:hypothetical protein